MTVTATSPLSDVQIADGVNRVWVYPFKITSTGQIGLHLMNGAESFVTGGYTVTGLNNDAGGTVTYPIAPEPPLANGTQVIVRRKMNFEQPDRLANQGPYLPRIHENAFDRLEMQIQEVAEIVSRAVVTSVWTPPSGPPGTGSGIPATVLPPPDPGSVLIWGPGGVLENSEFAAGDFDTAVINAQAAAEIATGMAAQATDAAAMANSFSFLNTSYKRSTEEAQSLTTPNQLRKEGVLASLYCPSSDSLDCSAGLVAAFAAAGGRPVRLDNPWGTSRVYRILSRSAPNLVIPNGTHLIGDPLAVLDFSAIGASGTAKSLLGASGSETAAVTLTVPVTAGATTLTLPIGWAANLGSLARGDLINISSNKLFITGAAGVGFQGETRMVKSIAGDVVTIYEAFDDSYATVDVAVVKKVNPARNVTIEGIKIKGPGRFAASAIGDNGLYIAHGYNVHVRGCEVEACDNQAIRLLNCTHFSAEYNTIIHAAEGASTANQYGIAFINACQYGYIGHNAIYGGKHGIAQSETSTPKGVTRDVLIDDNYVHGTWSYGISTHTNCERIEITRNKIVACNSGIEIGSRRCGTSYNRIRFTDVVDVGVGILVDEVTERIHSIGDIVENGIYGWRLGISDVQLPGSLGPIEIQIRDFTCIGVTNQAISLNYDDTTAEKKGLIIDGVKTEACAGVSIAITGTFDEGLIANCNLRTSGAGGACITTASVTDFEVRDIEYQSPYTAPSLGGTRIRTDNIKAWGKTAPTIVVITAGGSGTSAEDFALYQSNTGTADNLDSLAPLGFGTVRYLKALATHTITVTNGVGNIRTSTGASIVMTGNTILMAICDGTNWYVLA